MTVGTQAVGYEHRLPIEAMGLGGNGTLLEEFRKATSSARNSLLDTLPQADVKMDFAHSVVDGLSNQERSLDCRYLYDARGSALYEQITQQQEYYLTRTESAILHDHADEIRRLSGPCTLLELGSGSSLKTDRLLAAWLAANGSERVTYVPVDVSASALFQASVRIQQRLTGVRIIGVHGTYDEGLALLRETTPVIGMLLGSTIGNFGRHEAQTFFENVATHLAPGDQFLLGVDLAKEVDLLEAAYNDRAGVTAKFTLNLFERMNRELGSSLVVSDIEHVARYSARRQQVEIFARFIRSQQIVVEPLDFEVTIAAGEELLVEVSRKFVVAELTEQLRAVGLEVEKTLTDQREWYAVLLLKRTDG
jgi:L-histidine N-alpha-methyltransferase